MHGFSGGTYISSSRNRTTAHVLLLVPEPVREAADLPVPEAGNDVVYLDTSIIARTSLDGVAFKFSNGNAAIPRKRSLGESSSLTIEAP